MGLFNDIVTWATYLWWLWLFLVAWWYYNWSKEHLAFSPTMTLVVGGILVYFLVIEHPLIGSAGMLFWVVLMSGVLYLLPMAGALFNTILPRKPPGGMMR